MWNLLIVGCVASLLAPALGAGETGDPLAAAAAEAAAGRFDAAVGALRAAFDDGYPTPSRVHSDPRFAGLREDVAARGAWRELASRHVRESSIRIVSADEPGRPMVVRGQVVASADGRGIGDAVVYLYHTDATGNYAPDTPVGQGSNPRLFGFVRTAEDGRFTVHTIRAEPYPGASPRAAHVHYRVEAPGHGVVRNQFRPYTDPAGEAERASAVRRGRPVSEVRSAGDGLICEVTIPLP